MLTLKKVNLNTGPIVKKDQNRTDDLQPGEYPGFSEMSDISELIGQSGVPDFSKQHSQVVSLRVEVPDSPMTIGLDSMNCRFAEVGNFKNVLQDHRSEALGILSDWKSLKFDYDRLLTIIKRTLTKNTAFKELKNVQQRTEYLDKNTEFEYELGIRISQAIQRCTDFIEVCRKQGTTLDSVLSALSKQIEVLKIQIHLKEYLPNDVKE